LEIFRYANCFGAAGDQRDVSLTKTFDRNISTKFLLFSGVSAPAHVLSALAAGHPAGEGLRPAVSR